MKFSLLDDQIFEGKFSFGVLPISTDETVGYKPMQLFVSSMVGCSSSILVNILNKKRVNVSDVIVNVNVDRNSEEANRIEAMEIVATVYSNEKMNDKQLNKLSELVIKNCGMLQTIIKSVNLTYTIEFVEGKME